MTSAYSAAGVNLDAAETVVDAIKEAVTATWGTNVVGSFGGFAGGFRIPAGYTDPILMMSTDGIGTKLDFARKVGLVEGIGFDLVAMVIDDLAAAGAQALALTDYVAVGRLDPVEVLRHCLLDCPRVLFGRSCPHRGRDCRASGNVA